MKQGNLNTTLVLGFFDGIHLGHRTVIKSAVEFANKNNSRTILLTFPQSPAEYFNDNTKYIFPREVNYKLINKLGITEINETSFSSLINISAEDYLENIINKFSPIAIFTGFNYTFGKNRQGTTRLLQQNQAKYHYEYHCIEPVVYNNQIVSSTLTKKYLKEGDTEKASLLLSQPFFISSKVITGAKIGRTIGFPTANMLYPQDIIKIPHGVYKVKALERNAVLNWGIKPTINGKEPVLEVHIPNYSGDLYGRILDIQILRKIREEKRFNSLSELQEQIKKDIEVCLE